MKPDKKTQWGFYVLSMTAFFAIIFILGTDIPVYFGKDAEFIGIGECLTSPGIVIPFICIVVFCWILNFIFVLKRRIKGTTLGPIIVKDVENANIDPMVFVASYFLPIVSFNIEEKWKHVFVLLILFFLIGIIYVSTNIYYANPTLFIFGYKVYKVDALKLDNKLKCVIITRDNIKVGDKLKYIPIDDGTFYAIKEI